jgi:arogenate dehydrogenase (NADP+)
MVQEFSGFGIFCGDGSQSSRRLSYLESGYCPPVFGMDIGIVGLGLIGASLAGDFRRIGHQIYGVSRQQSTCEFAVANGLVDRAATDLATLAACEIIMICTPIDKIVPTVSLLAPHLSPETIVTDAGSVKELIVVPATQIWPNFVGGHPMAGKAESGIKAAELGMFRDKPYVVTPIANTNPIAVDKIKNLVKSLDCRLFESSPAAHDQAVAWISHLPVMISSSLIHACLENCPPDLLKLAKGLASSGFKDTSRVGGGNPELGQMMAEYNSTALLAALRAYQQDLNATIESIEANNWSQFLTKIERTQMARPDFLN